MAVLPVSLVLLTRSDAYVGGLNLLPLMATAPDLSAPARRGPISVSDLPDDTEGARYELIDGPTINVIATHIR